MAVDLRPAGPGFGHDVEQALKEPAHVEIVLALPAEVIELPHGATVLLTPSYVIVRRSPGARWQAFPASAVRVIQEVPEPPNPRDRDDGQIHD